jgi:prephenate dehydratase
MTSVPSTPSDADRRIAFQGEPQAYSHLACLEAFPDREPLPCPTFEDAFAAVQEGRAGLALIPIENSVAGRVTDIHRLMPESKLHIIGEHFSRVKHHLLAVKGAKLADIKTVRSHIHALGQCRNFLAKHGIKAVVAADTAGSAAEVAAKGDKSVAAIASELAGRFYGLDSLASNIEDAEHNTTRFLVMAREPKEPAPGSGPCITTFIFRVRNVPAALYKAMGGFATNGVNMTKLESYQINGTFTATLFYADVEGHPQDVGLRHALEELDFFSAELRILGVYPAHPFRFQARKAAGG